MMLTLRPSFSSSVSSSKDCYIYEILPIQSLLGVSSSDDEIRLVDKSNLKVVSHGSHAGITKMVPEGKSGTGLVSCGSSGQVKAWEARTSLKERWTIDEGPSELLSVASSPSGLKIAVGTSFSQHTATISVWDVRKLSEPLVRYVESHNDDITELQFLSEEILLSGGTDGLVNIYNTSIEDEDDALIQVINHGSSISHAGLLNGNEADGLVYALSHDEKLAFYRRTEPDEDGMDEAENEQSDKVVDFGDARQVFGCEYVVGVYPTAEGALIGAGKHSEHRLELASVTENSNWSLQPDSTMLLETAHGEEIVRTICFSHSDNVIYTGGEDGLVKVWQTNGAGTNNGASSPKTTGPPEKSKRNKEKLYKPY